MARGARPQRSTRGQAATETMIMMMFLFLMIFGLIHMSMLAATKYMVNFAAFSAARTIMVRGDDASGLQMWAYTAASGVIDNIRWWNEAWRNRPDLPITTGDERGRHGVYVVYRVPFGLPIFNAVPAGGFRMIGFAPYQVQPDIDEVGDNAE